MTKRYTDAHVEELVREVRGLLDAAYFRDGWLTWSKRLDQAIAPFLPDPEDALIEEMAMAISAPGEWYGLLRVHQDLRREQARAALDVVKREGLPT